MLLTRPGIGLKRRRGGVSSFQIWFSFKEIVSCKSVPLHVIHLNQDDPRKCTARKLQKNGLVSLHDSPNGAPRRGYLLDPRSNTILAPEDRGLISLGGSIVVLDCSWKLIEESLDLIAGKTRLEGRILPFLLAANPVSWGKIGRLSLCRGIGSLFGYSRAMGASRGYCPNLPFGNQFLDLNREPLEAYSTARSRDEILEIQREFFD